MEQDAQREAPTRTALSRHPEVPRFDHRLEFPSGACATTQHLDLVVVDQESFYVFSPTGRDLFIATMREVGGCYTELHPDLVRLCREHPEMKPPENVQILAFQFLNLLLAHPELAFTRDDLEEIGELLAAEFGVRRSRDVIQSVNKTGQWGLAPGTVKRNGITYYRFPRPLRYHPYGRQISTPLGSGARLSDEAWNALIDKQKAWHHSNFCEVSNRDYDRAHMVPGSDVVVPQPKHINRSRRDWFIFDQWGMPVLPTPPHAVRLMRKHYSPQELRAVLAALQVEVGLAEGSTAAPQE